MQKSGNNINRVSCRLCESGSDLFYEEGKKKYYRCGRCSAVFLDPVCFLSREQEKARYEKHENSLGDQGYLGFLEPLISLIEQSFGPRHKGLDFGSGPEPAVASLLRQKGYSVELYDPFFCNNPGSLLNKYDFIACSEVIEHFHYPARLRSLLKPGGVLFCMTSLYSKNIDFRNWYYKDDPTHVIFYHRNTLEHIRSLAGFSSVIAAGRIIRFTC